jgi:hypothetical protein
MYPILIKQQMIAYFRYVDDILILYDQNKTNIEQTLSKFNKLQPSIKFTTEKELQESIIFLDLSVHHRDRKLKFSIYRKPTQADVIPNSSCHPYEQTIRY